MLKVIRHRHLRGIDWFSLLDAPELTFFNDDALLTRQLFWRGRNGYETAESDWWICYCREAKNVLEIGANIGFHTVQGAKAFTGASYVAVEPHPVTVNTLKRNLSLNNIQNVVVIEAAVVGEKNDEKLELSIPDVRDPLDAYLATLTETQHRSVSRSVLVDVIGISELIDDVDLIKLDVEGAECGILSSVVDVIKRNEPTIFVEVLEDAKGLRQLLVDLCNSANYNAYAMGALGIQRLPNEGLLTANLMMDFDTRDVLLTTAPLLVLHS